MVTGTGDGSRFRCGGCGNLTRFDVVATRRTRQFLHFTIAGDPSIEEEEILDETVERITCRWCGSSDAIEVVPRAAADERGSDVHG